MDWTGLSVNLAGAWNYRLDPEDKGIDEAWFHGVLPNGGFRMPGTTSEHGIGEQLKPEKELTKEAVRSLRQRFRYVGAAWYEREIRIPAEWTGKIVTLFLERVMFGSRVWVDGRLVGERDSLSTPHVYELTGYVTPGSVHRLTVRVDNRDIRRIGPYPSAYTDETQTIWNGIVGRLELRAADPVHCADVQVYPHPAEGKIRVKAMLANRTGTASRVRLSVQAQSENTEIPHTVAPISCELVISGEAEVYEFEYALGGGVQLWDEFSPALYRLVVSLQATAGDRVCCDEKIVRFGMREFQADGTQFAVNGRKTFLRGTLDCCIYPLTGYPPTDVDAWMRVFLVMKEYGLNHLRFHSWCPPEAAFTAADRLGVYLQVEGPVWMDTWNGYLVGSREEHYDYLPAEAVRIIDAYGNHPSFCLFSNGNELKGDFQLLHDIIAGLKQRDGRRVYTLTSNWDRPLDPADDFFVAQTVDGTGVRGQYFLSRMAAGTTLDFSQAVSRRNVPVISHEVGQYAVYPNIEEIPKYSGVLRPVNFEAIRADLERKQMLEDAAHFTRGSGMLAVQLYREEIEAALRTPGLAGFQLLDLHDFPGQSTATVGILDSFWDSKGLIEPERFRQFCGPTVLLLQMQKRIYANDERFSARIAVSHFGRETLGRDILRWTVAASSGVPAASGEILVERVPIGSGTPLGGISDVSLEPVAEPARLTVTLALEKAGIQNSWDIWVYPVSVPDEPEPLDAGIVVATAFDAEVERSLAAGKRVLLLPSEADLRECLPGKFFPVFWSPVHFASEDPCGIWVNRGHAIFRQFPTEEYAGFQWKELLEHSVSVCLDGLPPEFKPIVQVIPNFFHNRRLGNLFEANVGNGKLVVCTLNLTDRLDERKAAAQLRRSILSYMAGSQFNPAHRLSVEQIAQLFRPGGAVAAAEQHLPLPGT